MWTVKARWPVRCATSDGFGAAEVIQDDDLSAGPADAAHLAGDRDRVGDDADHIRRVDDVEGVVGELQVGASISQQTDVPEPFARDAVARLLEHELEKSMPVTAQSVDRARR